MSLGAYVAMAVAGGLGMYFGIGAYFEAVYYRRRRHEPEAWKCQPRRFAPARMRQHEFVLGTVNMIAGSLVSGWFAWRVAEGKLSAISFDTSLAAIPGAVALTLAYFLATDCALYWAHRLLHRPLAFRWIHRWHHRYTSPTAFTAGAMHPAEFFLYQGIMVVPLLLVPVHVAGVIFVLVYQNFVALVDHSGVRTRSWVSFQPPAQFHDDHHVYFHVNYGQTLGLWDRVFGTWRRVDRRYGIDVFGGKGAPLGPADGPPRLVDYTEDRFARAGAAADTAPVGGTAP